jgi:hypothetical protein
LLATVRSLSVAEKSRELEIAIEKAHHTADIVKRAEAFRDKVVAR